MGTQDLVIRYVAYAVMLAVVAAGVAGLLEREGGTRTAGATGEAGVDYPRVTRQGLKPSLVVDVLNTSRRAREPTVIISSEYLEGLQLAGLTPDPAEAAGWATGSSSTGSHRSGPARACAHRSPSASTSRPGACASRRRSASPSETNSCLTPS